MSDDLIFREVDEELRHEQMRSLWRRYGVYIVAAAVLVIAGVAGFKGWQWYEERQSAQSGARYQEALQLIADGKQDEALPILESLAGEGSGGYPVLARLVAAGAMAEAGQREEAIAAYDEAATQSSDDLLTDLARVQAAILAVDTAPREEIQDRVGALDEETNPWRNQAREVLALAAYRDGDMEAAAGLYEKILADNQTPQELNRRAELMMAVISPTLAPPGAEAGPDTPAAATPPVTRDGEADLTPNEPDESDAAPAGPAAGGASGAQDGAQ